MTGRDKRKAQYKNVCRSANDPGIGLHARNKEVRNEPEEHGDESDPDVGNTESQVQQQLQMAPIR